MNPILALAWKDIRLLLRDRMGFFFSFAFPLIYAIFFGVVFSGDSSTDAIPVAMVDEDKSVSSRAFVDTLTASGHLNIVEATREQATKLVRRGKRTAFIALPKGFGEARRQRFSGQTPEIEIALDPARQAEGAMLEGLLMKYMAESLQQTMSDPAVLRAQVQSSLAGIDSANALPESQQTALRSFLAQFDTLVASGVTTPADTSSGSGRFSGFNPVNIRTSSIERQRSGPRSSYEFSFPQGILWGILSTALGFALSLVIERRQGTLLRLRSAPIRRESILAGKALACFLTILTVTTILLLVARFVFNVRPDSIPLLILAVLSTAIGFVGVMMVISILGKTESAVSGLGWSAMMIMAMTGGGMVPLFVMPPWVQMVGNVSPVKWGILALEGAIWRSFSLTEMMLPCGILMAVGIIGFTLGARAFRWTEG